VGLGDPRRVLLGAGGVAVGTGMAGPTRPEGAPQAPARTRTTSEIAHPRIGLFNATPRPSAR